MDKIIVEYRNTDKIIEVFIAPIPDPETHQKIRKELEEFGDVVFDAIHADSIRAFLSGNYEFVKKLEKEKGYLFK